MPFFNRKKQGSAIVGVLIALIIVLLILNAGAIWLCVSIPTAQAPAATEPPTIATEEATEPPTTEPETEPPTTMPEPEHEVSTATILSTGDVLMHMPVIGSGSGPDGYNFDSIFRFVTDEISAADLAVANLETTLAGTDNGYNYSGFPNFNCPDAIVDALKNAGFDMLLTANNHSYDTTLVGFKRTLEVVREAGLETLGTYLSADEQKWTIQDVNGIKIGLLCYTYATGVGSNGSPQLNGNAAISEPGLCNYFTYSNLPAFYSEVETYLQEMKDAGAEATMLYIHWGTEYQTYANKTQKKMAQDLRDLGIDVIVGNHAHVIQPVELLTNTKDESKKTLCLYSMGNAVSNIYYINGKFPVETEDGMLFKVTFAKYSDGTVVLVSAEVLPTWVYRYPENGVGKYRILAMPTDSKETWQEDMELTDALLKKCQNSYDRTMKIVGEGMTAANEYYAQHQAEVEASIGVTK